MGRRCLARPPAVPGSEDIPDIHCREPAQTGLHQGPGDVPGHVHEESVGFEPDGDAVPCSGHPERPE